jgi:hypothetical protein
VTNPPHPSHEPPCWILLPQAYKFKRSATGLFLRGGVLDKPNLGAMTFVHFDPVTHMVRIS